MPQFGKAEELYFSSVSSIVKMRSMKPPVALMYLLYIWASSPTVKDCFCIDDY